MNRLLPFLFSALLWIGNTPLDAQTPVMLQSTDDPNIAFSSLRGKWVFINYWASWCGPCIDEVPELNRFYTEHKNKKVALFAVNYDGLSSDEQRELAKKWHLKYPSLLNDPAAALDLGDIQVLPMTFVFNPQGELHDILYGGQTQANLNAYLNEDALNNRITRRNNR